MEEDDEEEKEERVAEEDGVCFVFNFDGCACILPVDGTTLGVLHTLLASSITTHSFNLAFRHRLKKSLLCLQTRPLFIRRRHCEPALNTLFLGG